MKLLPITTDSEHAFTINPRPPLPPLPPVDVGGIARLTYEIRGEPMRFVRLRIGSGASVESLGPGGVVRSSDSREDEALKWSVDRVTIDGIPAVDSERDWGVGRKVVMHVTNTSDAPRHFYATWECEDV